MSTSSLSKQRFTLVDFQMYCTCIANFNIKSNEIITLHSKYKIYEVDFSISMAKRDLLIRDSSDENVPLSFGCFLNWKKETTPGNIQIKKIPTLLTREVSDFKQFPCWVGCYKHVCLRLFLLSYAFSRPIICEC